MKLSKTILAVIEQHQESIEHCARIAARSRVGCEYLPAWFSDKPAEYYDGMQQGACAAIEALLHAHRQYKGYNEVHIDASPVPMVKIPVTFNRYY